MLWAKPQEVLYKKLARPLFFRIDPERIHNQFIFFGRALGGFPISRVATKGLYTFADPALEQTILNLRFPNPVGLAAGFDKNARMINIMPAVGFGFHEIGSVTGEPCEGNPKPRLWRLPKSKSLVVYYGLKNDGCEVLTKRIGHANHRIPIAVSIAKTNSPKTADTTAGIADYAKAFSTMEPAADFLVINISCPNAFGGEPFSSPERLEFLLSALDPLPTTKPIFLKLSADTALETLDDLLAVVKRHRVHGFIATNLTKKRENPKIIEAERTIGKGGISGRPMFDLSNQLLSELYKRTDGKYNLIGTGGIFSAEDAYEKIRLGASLVQLITGMIYEGPQLIGQINRGLVELMRRDGYTHISQAIGAAHRKK